MCANTLRQNKAQLVAGTERSHSVTGHDQQGITLEKK